MPFQTAVSGLNAASADLRVTGNNIANSGTVGFKESRAEFSEVFAIHQSGINKTAIGAGVRLAGVAQQFTQGNIDFTGKSLDLAINGDGFFVLRDSGTQVYSRAGAFQADREGYVVNNEGGRLQVYPRGSEVRGDFDTSRLEDLRLSTSEVPPRATTEISASLNLPSGTEAIDDLVVFDIDNPDSFNHSTSVNVYDSLGQSHTATIYFRSTDPNANQWQTHVVINGAEVASEGLEFDSQGRVSDGGLISFSHVIGNGANPLEIELDLGSATQYGGAFNVSSLRQDGFATGNLSGIDIDSNGVVFARFTNGQSQSLGKVAVADFQNPQGLQQLGDNVWAETFASGQPIRGEAGAGHLGLIQSGGLESSNVDIAQQLVNLITAQRNFQANAQVISAADTMTQTVINIR